MTATVRKAGEELTDKRKCMVGNLTTDLGLTFFGRYLSTIITVFIADYNGIYRILCPQ